MKRFNKILSLILLLAISATCLATSAFAAEVGTGTTAEEVIKVYENAEIMLAKGGANGIVSMTFDDDHMPTALILNELFEEYGGLKGTIYMRSERMFTVEGKTKEAWDAVFGKGYLEPQSHAALHLNLSNSVNQNDSEGRTWWVINNGPESMVTEIVGSQNTLNTEFPDFDCISFAIPNSNYHTPADQLLAKTYHASRGGGCPFTSAGIQTGFAVQTLDPKVGYSSGDWSNLQIARLTPNQDGIELSENLEYLKTCAENGGWYISMTHGVFEVGKEYSGIHNDCSVDDMEAFCAAVSNYVEDGKIWCTTFSEATKYVRERQNSTVRQYATESGIYVDLTMAATTKDDNLALDADVFNVPLTVKVELPNGWQNVTVTQGTTTNNYSTFVESGVTFAYIELVPNGGTASLSNAGDYSDYIDSITIYQNITIEEKIAYNLYFPADDKVESISVNDVVLTPVATDKYAGYNVYTVDNIYTTDVNKQFNFTVKFTEESKLDPYMFTTSVLKYLTDVGNADVSDTEKQLCFDFATYLKDAYVKFMEDKKSTLEAWEQAVFVIDTSMYDNALAPYAGSVLSTPNLGAAANVGNLGDAFSGVSFTLNEKPYYLLHMDAGFYGTITVTLGDKTETFEIINGYYHAKSYLIIEVDGLCNLLDSLTITAVGSIGVSDTPTINASGSYNVANYYETVKIKDKTPAYATSLAAYITSAKAYLDSAAQA